MKSISQENSMPLDYAKLVTTLGGLSPKQIAADDHRFHKEVDGGLTVVARHGAAWKLKTAPRLIADAANKVANRSEGEPADTYPEEKAQLAAEVMQAIRNTYGIAIGNMLIAKAKISENNWVGPKQMRSVYDRARKLMPEASCKILESIDCRGDIFVLIPQIRALKDDQQFFREFTLRVRNLAGFDEGTLTPPQLQATALQMLQGPWQQQYVAACTAALDRACVNASAGEHGRPENCQLLGTRITENEARRLVGLARQHILPRVQHVDQAQGFSLEVVHEAGSIFRSERLLEGRARLLEPGPPRTALVNRLQQDYQRPYPAAEVNGLLDAVKPRYGDHEGLISDPARVVAELAAQEAGRIFRSQRLQQGIDALLQPSFARNVFQKQLADILFKNEPGDEKPRRLKDPEFEDLVNAVKKRFNEPAHHAALLTGDPLSFIKAQLLAGSQ
jgi:hypothetical protein